MNEKIHYFDDIKNQEEFFKRFSNFHSFKYFSYQNNNDTLYILSSTLLRLKSFLLSLYNYFISYISSMNQFIYKLQIILLLITFLFSFVITFEENSDIPTNLIISAYFPQHYLTSITYDMIKEEQNTEDDSNLDKINFDDFNKLIKEKIDKYTKDNNDHYSKKYTNEQCSCNGDIVSFNNKEYMCGHSNINNKKIKEELLDEIKMKIKNQPQINPRNLIPHKNNEFIFLYNTTIKLILINSLSFSLLYCFIKFTLNTKIRCSFLFNFFFLFISFNFLYVFYKNEYYLASNFFFILFMYTNKNLIDSIYLKLKYKRKDFEIFSTNLMAFDFKQFHLKCILLMNITILSGLLSIFFFKSFINYIVFYICLFTLIVFLGNTIEPIMPYYLKPIKNIVIFTCGFINFFISKIIIKYLLNQTTVIINNKYLKNLIKIYDNNSKNDSLYFVSDLFSLFCFDYIRGYLEFQIEVNLLFENYFDDNDEIPKHRLNIIALNQFGIWIFLLWISMLLGIIGIFKKEYICLIMSIYLIKILMNYFCSIYDAKLSRYFFYLHCFVFLIVNLEISIDEDTYLVNLFSIFTIIDKNILLFLLKLITILFIAYYIIDINIILYNSFLDRFKYEKEIRKIRKDNEDENIYHIEIENVPIENYKIFIKCIDIFFDCFINYFIICILIKVNLSYEKSLVFKALYGILASIFHIIKTLIINEIRNKFEYYLYLLLWFLFSVRLIHLSNSQISFIFFINHINLLILIILYFLNKKRNFLFASFIILFLVIEYYRLNSYMFIINIIFVFTTLILIKIININITDDNENDDNKNLDENEKSEEVGNMNVYNSVSLLFLLPILVFFILQLKIKSFFNFLNKLDKFIKELMIKMYILYDDVNEERNFEENEPKEFFLISQIIYIMKIASENI